MYIILVFIITFDSINIEYYLIKQICSTQESNIYQLSPQHKRR